jgi:hypothetical protein
MEVFRLQKKIIRIMMGAGSRDSCREVFKMLVILPLMAEYIYTIKVFFSIMESNSPKLVNYMTLKLEITRTYFSHNPIYLSVKRLTVTTVQSALLVRLV